LIAKYHGKLKAMKLLLVAFSIFMLTGYCLNISLKQKSLEKMAKILVASNMLVLSGCSIHLPVIMNNAFAVSGGGKDYATAVIREEDFSSKTLLSKDFSGCGKSK
jgi:hypothetical protein